MSLEFKLMLSMLGSMSHCDLMAVINIILHSVGTALIPWLRYARANTRTRSRSRLRLVMSHVICANFVPWFWSRPSNRIS
jgi:hypothetical protein